MTQPMREKFRLEDKVNNLLSYRVLFSKLYIKGVTGEGKKKNQKEYRNTIQQVY